MFSEMTISLRREWFEFLQKVDTLAEQVKVSAEADLAENPPIPIGALVREKGSNSNRDYKVLFFTANVSGGRIVALVHCQHVLKNGSLGDNRTFRLGLVEPIA